MKLSKIALAVLATAATAASAGVTVSPLLLGYQYNDEAHDKQRAVLLTDDQLNNARQAEGADVNSPLNGGVALVNDLWTGAAIGVELTPSTQFQVEYGVTNADARASKASEEAGFRFDAEQQTVSGNFLVGTEQFTGYNANSKFKPYVLIGGGQQKTKIEDKAGNQVTSSKDTVGNIGLGARYLVNDALALRGEVRGVHNFDNEWWQGLAIAGLEVTLGGRLAPAAAPAPVATVAPVVVEDVVVDSDQDGVADHLDACPNTPRNVVVDARGCPQQVNLTESVSRELRVFFDRDKSDIKPQYREEVAKVAQLMREVPSATAVIEGHASKDSNRSSAKYNQRLSEARANAVKAMLANEFGVAPNRLSAVGYGFDRPIAPNTTDEGRVQNRRVIAVISGQKTTTVNQTKDMVVR